MRKNLKVGLSQALCLSLCLTLAIPAVSYAGTWEGSSGAWVYRQDSGEIAKSCWILDAGQWYLFDGSGNMLTGWQQAPDGRRYFLNPAGGATDRPEGAMLTGWRWIDGKCYYLAAAGDASHPEGSLYVSGTTPDGYTVNDSGAWTEGGQEVLNPSIGIKTGPAAGTVKMSAGGSGGGGGASGGGGSGGGSGGSSAKSEPKKPKEPVKPEPEPIIPENTEVPDDTVNEEPEIKVTAPETPVPNDEEEPEIASPSDAEPEDTEGNLDIYDVNWTVHFVDKETHQLHLLSSRSGTATNGSTLSIGYVTKLIDSKGNTWEAVRDPHDVTIYGPGDAVIYIEFVLTKPAEEEEDPESAAKEKLAEWILQAKYYDSIITGEDEDDIPDERFIADSLTQSDLRLKTIAEQITDSDTYVIFEIGRNIEPNGIIFKSVFDNHVTYSHIVSDSISFGGDTYTVARFTVRRTYTEDDCLHQWVTNVIDEASCLDKGNERFTCSLCGKTKNVKTAAIGHIDEDGDSVCDRCHERAFTQTVGDVITASLDGNPMQFVCVDEDYGDGMLYVAACGIAAEDLGGYGSENYEETGVFSYFAHDFGNEFSINGANLLLVTAETTTAYAFMLSESEALAYKDIYGGDYQTRTISSGQAVLVKSDGTEEGTDIDDPSMQIRPAVVLKKTDEGEAVPTHWEVGDRISREIHGETYEFTCIDQNYSDKLGNHQSQALFLCDTVIPADLGCEYAYEDLGDGHFGYVFHAGPISSFGDTNDYKYSNIRKWLDEVTVFSAADIQIGNPSSFTGSTAENKYSELNENDLRTYAIGYQKMNARLYVMSVDEALKYKDWLWKFQGSDVENPEDEIDQAKSAYWLRSPNGTSYDFDETGMVYVVDMEKGCIRPQYVKPEGGTGDDYIDNVTDVGIRPAFILPQG